jgi:hypothetical protein
VDISRKDQLWPIGQITSDLVKIISGLVKIAWGPVVKTL